MRKRKKLPAAIWALISLAGLALLLYPTLSDWWSRSRQSETATGYAAAVARLGPEGVEQMWAEADAYNADLRPLAAPTAAAHARYEQTLDVTGSGLMGYVCIPKLEVRLPIYHGTDETVLQVAAGHIEGSSLPVGGEGTHCALSGHCGLPSARLFTDLDKLAEGDTFTLEVLGRSLVYEVDQITVVLPNDLAALAPVPRQDCCTLVTCTPYGVNSHRLLVRGHRIEAAPGLSHSIGRAAAPLLAACLTALLFHLLSQRRMTRRQKKTSTGKQTFTGEGPQ